MHKNPKSIKMQVWWVPQVPMKRFIVEILEPMVSASRVTKQCRMVDQAKFLLKALANYDLFQLANNIKPDFCNAGGLEVIEDGEWVEWNNEDGYDISEIMRDEAST